MDSKLIDHAYHRSRVDSHISMSIGFVLFIVLLAFLQGDKFSPFQQGANFWSPTLLIWQAEQDAWLPLHKVWLVGGLHAKPAKYQVMEPRTSDNRMSSGSETGELAEPDVGTNGTGAGVTTAPSDAPSSEPAREAAWRRGGAKYLVSQYEGGTPPVVITKEIHPISYSLVFVVAVLIAWWFLYHCARRQTYLMLSVYREDDERRPYDRPWEEIRVTFWTMFLVLLGAIFLFLM